MNANGFSSNECQNQTQRLAFERDLFADLSFLRNRALMQAVLVSCMNGILYNLVTFAVTYYTSSITVSPITAIGIVLYQCTN